MSKSYKLIGVASGWGAQIKECEDGPDALFKYDLVSKLRSKLISISSNEILYPLLQHKQGSLSLKDSLPLVHDINLRLCQSVYDTLQRGDMPILLGGDHSMAVGTWNGVRKHFTGNPLGLIWIDAHMDSHVEETTPSGAWHGMPLAGLLGFGHPFFSALQSARPVVHPEHVCLIGIRSFEEGEAQLLQKNKVKVYFHEEVKQRGLKAILQMEIERLLNLGCVLGVSLDLDVLDPKIAPGVGSPTPNGLSKEELLEAIKLFDRYQKSMSAFELVEYNPHRDYEERTAEICLAVLSTMLKKQEDTSGLFRA